MTRSHSARKIAGFTLIEMMCAVAVAGVLSSVAFPTFQNVVHKARRSDARVALWHLQMSQERYRSDHASYASLAELGAVSTSPSGQYSLSIASSSDAGFRAQAMAVGLQASDAPCRYMQLVSDGLNVSHLSGNDATLSNNDAVNKQCWGI